MAAFTLTTIKCRRLFQIVVPGEYPAEWTHADGVGVVTTQELTAGEVVIFRPTITVDVDIRGKTFYYCPSTFVQAHNTSRGYYKFVIPSTAVATDSIQGIWMGTSITQDNRDINLDVNSVGGASGGFTIQHTIHVGADNKGYFQNTGLNNHDKLLKNSWDNPTELDNSDYNDFYHTSPYGEYRFKIYCNDSAGATVISEVDFPVGTIKLLGKWYNKNNANAAPDLTNPVWKVENSSGEINCLSLFEDCKVTLQVDFNAVNPIGLSIYVIETNTYNNLVTWWNNYGIDISWKRIFTDGSGASFGAKLRHPSNLWTLVAGTVYKSDWYIKAASLDPAKRYRIIACCYSDNDAIFQSFISPEYVACAVAAQTFYPATQELIDYNFQTADSIFTSVQDRLTFRMWSSDAQTATYLADLVAHIGVLPTIIPRKVEWIAYQTPTLLVRHVVDNLVWNFQNWQWDASISKFRAKFGAGDNTCPYPAQAVGLGLAVEFQNINDSFLSTDGASMDQMLGLIREFRVRYEANVPALQSFVNNIQVPVFENQNWAGKETVFEWRVTLEYSFMIAGVPVAYGDIQVYRTEINVAGYYENNELSPLITAKITNDGGNDFDPCADGYICIEATLDPSLTAADYNAIFYLDKTTYGINNLKERDDYLNVLQLQDTRTPIEIVGVSDWVTFPGGVARACCQVSLLDFNSGYRLSVIAKLKQP